MKGGFAKVGTLPRKMISPRTAISRRNATCCKIGNLDTKVNFAEDSVITKDSDSTKENNFDKDGNCAKKDAFAAEVTSPGRQVCQGRQLCQKVPSGWGYCMP
jgi:hypothetical protein